MERGFHVTRQSIHSVENCTVRIFELTLVSHHLDGPADKVSLAGTGIGIHDDDLLAFRTSGTEMLALTLGVVGDDTVGSLEYRLGRTVILFELDNTGTRKILLELQDESYISASERIDGLVIVAYNSDVAVT